jgi:cytochrome c oxidase subunit 3
MSPVVMFAALFVGVLTWLFVSSRLTAKSWEHPGSAAETAGMGIDPARIGLWAFMAVATSLFSLFSAAYLMRMHHGYWCHVDPPAVLWVNTALLIVAGIAFQRARVAADRGQKDRLLSAFSIGGVLTIAFLCGQYLAWRQLAPTMYFIQGSPATAFFHLLTAVHGLHVIGGLAVWGRSMARFAGGAEVIDVRLSVGLCTAYWHFLLLIWLALFALLTLT